MTSSPAASDVSPASAGRLSAERYLKFKSRYLTVEGYQMHYLDEGEGPTILLLHGNPTWCYFYRHLIKELRDRFRVIAPDYIGMGLSDHPADVHYRASDRVRQVQTLIDTLGVEKFSIVMHDWGGPIGTFLIQKNIDRVQSVVYLNTTLTETESLPRIIKSASKPFPGKWITKTSRKFLKFTTDLGSSRRLSREIKEGYYFPYQTSARRTAIWDFVHDIPFNDSHPTYPDLVEMAEGFKAMQKLPIQIIWGLKDPCFHRAMLGKVAQHFPKASVLEIPQASHLVLEDAPELSNRTIKNFFLRTVWKESVASDEHTAAMSASPGPQNALYESFAALAGRSDLGDAVITPTFFVDYVTYAHTSFRDLATKVYKYERGLSHLGLTPGDKVLMLVPPGIEFLALSYAVMGRGATPIFIDPGIGKENLFKCISDAAPDVFIGSPKAQLLRLKGKKLFPNLRFHVTATYIPFTGPNLSLLDTFSAKELPHAGSPGPGMIAFTSGATGVPKGVVFTNEMLREQLRIFREVFGIEEGLKDLPLLPIFSLFTIALGVCSVFPQIDSSRPLSLEPARVVKIIQDLGIHYSFGSPTLWDKISEYCVRHGEQFTSVKKVLMAGAPVPSSTLSRVQSILPHGEACTPYGATEALPVTMISAREILAASPVSAIGGEVGTLVGKTVSGVNLRIIPLDTPEGAPFASLKSLPPREIGEIIVQGKNISEHYLNRPEAVKSSKLYDGSIVWHRIGDVGYLDESGNLYFCGRKAHVVRAPERSYFSDPVELVFNAHEQVKRAALVCLSPGGRPAVVVEPYPQFWPTTEAARTRFREELLSLAVAHPVTKAIEQFFFHPSFPVDPRHNAKIFRDRLGEWASAVGNDGAIA